jgi:hypothetical protein
MSLFKALFRLFPADSVQLEDFNTEIVAHVLQSDPNSTLAWLRDIDATSLSDVDALIVSTQEDLDALEMHQSGSRPDISIRLRNDQHRELIYIESKVGSIEGDQQLRRYAEHLARRPDTHRVLVYITRHYEPKENINVDTVQFVQKRWSDFYRFFEALPKRSDVLDELLHFMKEHNMSQTNQFTTVDLLSLVNFSRARKLMDATLWESVHKKFAKVCGKVSYKESAYTELRNHLRYVMSATYGQKGELEILLGYWLDQELVTDSPWVGVTYAVNPKAPNREQIILAFEDFIKRKQGTWESFDLADERAWGGIRRGKNLQMFLAEQDHVRVLTKFFEDIIDDVAEFKRQYPKLPWNTTQGREMG